MHYNLMLQASSGLAEHSTQLQARLSSLAKFSLRLDDVIQWAMEMRTRMAVTRDMNPHEKSRTMDILTVREQVYFCLCIKF